MQARGRHSAGPCSRVAQAGLSVVYAHAYSLEPSSRVPQNKRHASRPPPPPIPILFMVTCHMSHRAPNS
eukprot:scaffold3669_cov117-Isochrysis_galbana.AAC.2